MFFGSSIVAKKVTTNDNAWTITEYTCVGTMMFRYSNTVRENYVDDMFIQEWPNFSNTNPPTPEARIYGGNHLINSYDERTKMFENTSSHIIASYFYKSEKTFIRFDKSSQKLLVVTNFDDGSGAKYEADCY